jgi:hypothetical protein
MYTAQIYHNDEPISVAEAVNRNLITVDENGDIWLKDDGLHLIKITGDLRLG